MNTCTIHFNYGNCEFPIYCNRLEELVNVLEDTVTKRAQLKENDVAEFMDADLVSSFTGVFNSANVAPPKGKLIVRVQQDGNSIEITSITQEALTKRGTPYLVCTIVWDRSLENSIFNRLQ